jgi:hypothetical protein
VCFFDGKSVACSLLGSLLPFSVYLLLMKACMAHSVVLIWNV